MNKKIFRLCIGIITISIIIFYVYFTPPMKLNDIINKEDVEEIMIFTNLTNNFEKPAENFIIDEKNDINEIISILNNYKYSKKFNLKNLIPKRPRTIPVETNYFIQMFITYGNFENQLRIQQLTIDTNNIVEIPNARRMLIEYRSSGGDKSIFEELSNWLEPIIEENI